MYTLNELLNRSTAPTEHSNSSDEMISIDVYSDCQARRSKEDLILPGLIANIGEQRLLLFIRSLSINREYIIGLNEHEQIFKEQLLLINTAEEHEYRSILISVRSNALGSIQSHMLRLEVSIIYTERPVCEGLEVVPYQLRNREAVFGELIELQHPRKSLI